MANEKTPKTEEVEAVDTGKKEALRVGLSIFILLAALTLGEYWIGSVASAWWAPLLLIAAIKASLVIRDYMHIGRLFSNEEELH